MGGKSSLIGLAVALAAILASASLDGGSLVSLINLPAAVLVIGGTAGAVLICHPLKDGGAAISGIATILRHRSPDYEKTVSSLVEVANIARRDGLLALENVETPDSLINQGLRIASDVLDLKDAETILLGVIETEQQELKRKAAVFDTLGSYAPAMGVIGTLIGLIRALTGLGDASAWAHSIAAAFVPSLYGIALASLIFGPLSARIRHISGELLRQREMILEGILAICQGETPGMVKLKTATFLKPSRAREKHPGGVATTR